MKLKELKRTVNVCWSPAEHYPVTLAAGSAAQQVDSSFSSSSYLELYYLNLEDPGLDLELKSSLQTQQKFQKIVWSGSEVLVGGCDGGLLQFYSSEKLLQSAPDSLLGTSDKHNGNVSALDINPYQKNLLASGASDSEIFIWDLNNTAQPMAPGNRSQPYDHVQGLAWNQQVQHILGSTFATRCVVWDLRKNEPIMKLSDSQSRTRWRSLAWHPSVATQLCIASEDDQGPVIQLWDLRLAASPLATLEGHRKGVTAVSWCRQDPDLLVSAGKDGRVLCWNPNNTQPGGELLTEISSRQQWVYDTAWCPRDPSLLVAASLDQLVTVYSLLGGSKPETSSIGQSSIMDSFGGVDTFSALPAVSRAAAPAPAQDVLRAPPRWLRRPAAARFAFGGKLVSFDNGAQEANTPKQVYISQVVSEPEILEKSIELEEALNSALSQEPDAVDKLAEYCLSRGDACTDQHERFTWFFLRAHFMNNFTAETLNLLGFKQDEIPSKFKPTNVSDTITQPELNALSRGESTETEAELSTDTSTDLSDAHTLIERKLANLDLEPAMENVVIPSGEDGTSLICRALVCGNLEEAVELCLDAKRVSDALIIASLGSQELVYKVQKYHLNATATDPVSLLTSSLLLSRWDALVAAADPACWRHTLAAIITHCDGEAQAHYCEMLGDKLSKSSSQSLSEAASICYVVGMCADTLVGCWSARAPHDVQRLAVLAVLAGRAATHRGRLLQSGGGVERAVCEYAGRVAAQGALRAARRALAAAPGAALADRLTRALGDQRPAPAQQQQYDRSRTVSGHSQQKGHYPAQNNVGYNQDPRYDRQWNKGASAWPPQAPQAPEPPQTQPPQPPRPGSVGPQGGLSSRSKYKVDPSVQPSQNYNQYGYTNPISTQPQSYGYNSPLPEPYQNSSVPNTFAPINPNPGLNPLNPGLNPVNPGLNSLNPGVNPLNPVNSSLNPLNPSINPLNPTMNPLNPGTTPAVNGSYYNQDAASVQNKPIQSGWNDPPMPSSKSKPKQEVQAQAPITHPLFGVEPPQHVPLAPVPTQQYPGQQQQYPGQQQQHPGQQQQYQQYPGQYDQQYQQQYQGAQGYQQQAEPGPVPEPPAEKAPLPERLAVLQAVLDRIRADCANRAHNTQMKRKLEDVHRRLETLYDLLRDDKLSDAAIQTLHTSVQYTRAGDYSGALAAATTLAGGADFAAAASFLPGLKVLFQLAAQLQVYVS